MSSMKGTVVRADFTKFIDRYVEVWNEPDDELRRKTIEALWVPGGANYTQSMAATGYEALGDRVTSAYQAYVRPGKYRFRRTEPPVAHHNAVRVQWEMVTVDDGSVTSVGVEFLILADDGRIISDHQFIVS
jgi:hypothetical protein